MSEISSRTCDVLSHFISVGQQFGEYVHNKEKKLAQQQIKILCMVSAPLIKSVVFYGDAARVFPGDDGQWSPVDK